MCNLDVRLIRQHFKVAFEIVFELLQAINAVEVEIFLFGHLWLHEVALFDVFDVLGLEDLIEGFELRIGLFKVCDKLSIFEY